MISSRQDGGHPRVSAETPSTIFHMRRTLFKIHYLFIIVYLYACVSDSERSSVRSPESLDVDVCVYTATASGIMAAIAAKKEGKEVVIVEPGKWVGGVLGAGIKPIQDCPNFDAVGGMTREVMKQLGMKKHSDSTTAADLRAAMSSTSPADLREDFLALLKEHDIRVIYDHRIQRTDNSGARIVSAVFDLAPFDEYGRPVPEPVSSETLRVKAKVFIDASYEGELMARTGVSFMSGREAEHDFKEENAGVRPPANLTPIDPYVKPGDPESGLLPLIDEDHGRPVGSSDYYTQAYNFRYYVTPDSSHRVPFEKPENYDPANYELVGRYVQHLVETFPDKEKLFRELRGIFPGWMNAGEYNYQRDVLITMAPVGVSHRYIHGDYATKARIWRYHQDYLSGLHHFMSTDVRVPAEFRDYVKGLGRDLRHHPETKGWPHQLYIRISRRLVGRYVISAADVYNKTNVDDGIALAQYGIDTYPSRRIAVEKDGRMWVGLEGKMFVGGAQGPTNVPYPVPYRSITPRKAECTNLLVPVCFSATHLGYASARMEPVFMICGESAGLAAAQAIEEQAAVQDINMTKYREKLKRAKQRLRWPLDSSINQ